MFFSGLPKISGNGWRPAGRFAALLTTAALLVGALASPLPAVADDGGVSFWGEEMFRPTLWVQAALLSIFGIVISWFVVRSYAANFNPVAMLSRILAIGVAILGIGMGTGAWFGSVYPPIFAVTSIGMLTFFICSTNPSEALPTRRYGTERTAITGSITVMYMALVGFGAFLRMPPGSRELDPLAQSLIVSFTSVVGIVIAFYFGTSAYLESRKPELKWSRAKVATVGVHAQSKRVS